MSHAPLRASVIVPAYNAAETLPATLAALARQTLPGEFEVIVVDDGSRDATAKIAENAGALVARQENRGPGAARNAGARLARGEILLFTDADCEPEPDWLERMLAPFADPLLVGAQGTYRTRQRSLAARFTQLEFEDRYRIQKKAGCISLAATYAAAYRRDVFLAHGGFDERFIAANNEDTEFSYRLAERGCDMVLAVDATVYHRHPETFGRYLRIKFWRAYWRMFVYREYPGKCACDGYTPHIVKFQAMAGAALLGLAPLAVFFPLWRDAFWLVLAGVTTSSLPFALRSLARDRRAALCAPGFVVLRSLAFGAGSLLGVWRARTW